MLSITGTRWNLSSLHQKHWGPPKLHCWNIELWWKRKTYSIYWQSQVFCKGNTNSYSSWKNKTRNPIPHEHQAHQWTFEMICFDLICVAMKSLPFSFPPFSLKLLLCPLKLLQRPQPWHCKDKDISSPRPCINPLLNCLIQTISTLPARTFVTLEYWH